VQPGGLPEGSAMYPNAGYAFAALFAVAVFAFWPSYFSQPSAASGYMHVHAAVMASWMLLLVVQPFLVRALPLTT
jgi:hypothetical protein